MEGPKVAGNGGTGSRSGQPRLGTGIDGEGVPLPKTAYLPRPMRSGRRDLLLGSFVAFVAAFAAGAWWLVRASPVAKPTAGPPPTASTPSDEPKSEPPTNRTQNLDAPLPEGAIPTTVAFPLKIELELLASSVRPKSEGVDALGSDATARLVGSVHGKDGKGIAAEVEFVAGPNAGRRLVASREGSFGANDLYAGLSVVRISSPACVGSLREILLRKGRETQLNVGYGRPGAVTGAVRDAMGDTIQDAKVSIDGQETRTDEKGEFSLAEVASGEAIAIAEKPGYATRMEKLVVVAGESVQKGRFAFILRPGSRLEVTIEERINADNEAQLFVLPESPGERDYPWFRLNPVSIYPGGTKTIEDLPAHRLTLRLFHAGAVATPPTRTVSLREKDTESVTLHLNASPIVFGAVTDDGRPAQGADVVLEAPARSQAALAVLGEANYLELEREVFPDFPPAVQHARTNDLGEFVLDNSEGVSRTRYLHATSSDGKRTAWKVLRGGETRVDLALEPARGDAELILQMAGRTQGLPVEIRVDGAPRDTQVLPPGQDLHVAGLAPGTWKFSARWNGEAIFDGMLIDLREETTLSLTLPEGAIVGQDLDTRKRSGK